MDIITQGLLGGAMAQAVARKQDSRIGAVIGFAAALLADADTLIRSAEDTLLNIEFHRQFSHSLIFIPFGALIAALLLWPLLRKRLQFKQIYIFALAGYATTGLLDACTSYGTHLLWPFSNERIAWNIISIFDPVFSLILLTALIVGMRQLIPRASQIGLLLACSYLLLGWWQHENALDAANHLAEQRGHAIDRVIVKPTLANLLLWRSIYESDGVFHVDGLRIGLFAKDQVYPGAQIQRFIPERDLPALQASTVLAHDIERFSFFSDGYVASDLKRDNVLIDVRYSMLPTGLAPLWGIEINPLAPSQHARFEVFRDRSEFSREAFTAMLLGQPAIPKAK